jgi:hypothetical protein
LYAAQFYGGDSTGQQNQLTMNTPVAANTSGKTYVVQFLGGPGNWAGCSQGTIAGNGLVFHVVRASNGTTLSTFTYSPAVWAGAETLSAGSFSYVGDGTGNVYLQIAATGPFGHFGGAITNLGIYAP